MTELETMKRARLYIEKLANGINPLDETEIPDGDIVNNVRISKCLHYVSGILDGAIEREIRKIPKEKKSEFSLSREQTDNFAFSDKPLSLSEFANVLNEKADLEHCNKIRYSDIADYLVELGALNAETTQSGKTVKRLTQKGAELGIFTEKRMCKNGEYTVILYHVSAQKFILDNLDAIIECKKRRNAEAPKKSKSSRREWSESDDDKLVELFEKGTNIEYIALLFARTITDVKKRLINLGYEI